MQELKELFKLLDSIFDNALIDYNELIKCNRDINFLDDIYNRRLANSFLFYFSKIQDKMGVKLFKKVLYQLGEIDNFAIPFIDILNNLEKLNIIKADEWMKIREIRNELSHEYPSEIDESLQTLNLALEVFPQMEQIYKNLKDSIARYI